MFNPIGYLGFPLRWIRDYIASGSQREYESVLKKAQERDDNRYFRDEIKSRFSDQQLTLTDIAQNLFQLGVIGSFEQKRRDAIRFVNAPRYGIGFKLEGLLDGEPLYASSVNVNHAEFLDAKPKSPLERL